MRTVGSFKKGTMLTGHPVADAVVILKTIPAGKPKIEFERKNFLKACCDISRTFSYSNFYLQSDLLA